MSSQLSKIPDHLSVQENPDRLEFNLENLRATADHWNAFFKEISDHMIEREELVDQTQLALLAKEHVLMLGHPGTAKSLMTKLILRRIVKPDGTPTNFEKQLGIESRKGDILGPVLPETKVRRQGNEELHQTKLVPQLDEGLRDYDFLSLDELFDAPPGVIRETCITALVDRILALGKKNVQLSLKTAFATSNKTMEFLREKFKEELDAVFDRFAFIYWTVQRPLRDDSPSKILTQDWQIRTGRIEGKKEGLKQAPLTTAELKLLNDLVDHVMYRFKKNTDLFNAAAEFHYIFQRELDNSEENFTEGYKRSKLGSARSLGLLNRILPAIAVLRWMKDTSSSLMVIPDDFKELKSFMMMRGPIIFDLPSDLDTITNKEDRTMLERMKTEEICFNDAFNKIWQKLQASRQAVPQNFPPLKSKVTRLTSNLNGPMTPSEIANGLKFLESKLDDLQIFSSQTTEGEEIYAYAVSTYLNLLAKHLEISPIGINNAVNAYNSAIQHIENFESGLYSSLITVAEDAFKKALISAHNPQNPQFPSEYERIRHLLDDTSKIEDILGHEVVSGIQSAIRRKTLDLITGAQNPRLEEYKNVYALYKEILEKGTNGYFPLEQVFHGHSRILSMLKDNIAFAENCIQAQGLGVLETTLKTINIWLSEYKQLLAKNEFTITKGLSLPEDVLNAYMSKRCESKSTSNSNGELKGKLESSSDKEVAIKWIKTSTEKRGLEQKHYEEYFDHCVNSLLENEDLLLKVPAISRLFEKIIRHAELYCHTAWNEDFKQMVQDEFISSVRSCVKHKKTEMFQWPFTLEVHGTAVRMSDKEISYDEVFDDVAKYTRSAIHPNEETTASFLLEKLDFPPTQKNISVFKNFVNQNACSVASVEVEIENTTSETEHIPMSDVIKEISAQYANEWERLHDEINSALKNLGQTAGKIIAQGHVMNLPSAGAITSPEEFVDKYKSFFENTQQNDSWKQQFEHIPITFSSSDEVIMSMKQDLINMAMTLSAENLIESAPSFQAISVFLSEKKIDTADLFASIKPVIEKKINEYSKYRSQQIISAEKQFTEEFTLSGDTVRDFETVREMAEGFINEIISKEELESFKDAVSCFNLDEQSTHEDQTQIASSGLSIILNIIDKAIEIVQNAKLPEIQFNMSDLNTITTENYEKIRDSLKEKGFFKTMDTWILNAENWTSEYKDLINVKLTKKLDEIKARKDALKNAYLDKLREVEGANI